METIIGRRIKAAGIPNITVPKESIKGYDQKYVKEFLKNKANMVVISDQYYEICVRVMMLKLHLDISLDIRWYSQSQLKSIDIRDLNHNCTALVSLYEEESTGWKGHTGAFMNQILAAGGHILLGTDSLEKLEGAFPYDSDRIEKEFLVWSI